jgi:hypothetical protein
MAQILYTRSPKILVPDLVADCQEKTQHKRGPQAGLVGAYKVLFVWNALSDALIAFETILASKITQVQTGTDQAQRREIFLLLVGYPRGRC